MIVICPNCGHHQRIRDRRRAKVACSVCNKVYPICECDSYGGLLVKKDADDDSA